MKIILSRKGFDVENGGMPSPILPDGTLLSLPIPSNDYTAYKDLSYGKKDYRTIIEELGKKPPRYPNCHLDPDIRKGVQKRPKGWKPIFGQGAIAESHLEKQGVAEGDLFLFFGWFKETEEIDGKLSFFRGAEDLHVIYGYLQVGKIVKGNDLLKYPWHPHSAYPGGNNTMYIASKKLVIGGKELDLPGSGTLKYSKDVVLTYPGMTRTKWKLPEFFKDVTISYHTPDSFKREGYFQSAHKGQEFVIDGSAKVRNWAKKIILNNIDR